MRRRHVAMMVGGACAVLGCRSDGREPVHAPAGPGATGVGAGGTAGPMALPPALQRPDSALGDGAFALDPIQYRSLTLVPIVSVSAVSSDDYLVLDEAMASGAVTIAELDGGSVNSLTLTNQGDRPVFLLAGEVVVGGKQDRIIGKNTIVAAASTEDIPVFCVEHGRWSGRQAKFTTAGVLAHASLREKASFEDQGDVWEEVSVKNAKRKTSNATDTYRHSAEQQTGESLTRWEQHFDTELGTLPRYVRDRLVGYAVALNGEVVALDTFDSPALFAKLDAKLRRSYYAEAVDVDPVDRPPPGPAAIRAFEARAAEAPEDKVYDNELAETINREAGDTASTEVMSKKRKAAAGKGKVKPVFKSVQRRKSK